MISELLAAQIVGYLHHGIRCRLLVSIRGEVLSPCTCGLTPLQQRLKAVDVNSLNLQRSPMVKDKHVNTETDSADRAVVVASAERAIRINWALVLALLPLAQDLILDGAAIKTATTATAKEAAIDETAKDSIAVLETVMGRDVVNDAAVLKLKDIAVKGVRDFIAGMADAKAGHAAAE